MTSANALAGATRAVWSVTSPDDTAKTFKATVTGDSVSATCGTTVVKAAGTGSTGFSITAGYIYVDLPTVPDSATTTTNTLALTTYAAACAASS